MAHDYRPLSPEELTFVLQRQWHRLGLDLDPDDFTDSQAVAAIARITRGNFRLIDRLFTQVERVMKINDLQTLTSDVVEAARSTSSSEPAKPTDRQTAPTMTAIYQQRSQSLGPHWVPNTAVCDAAGGHR